MAGMRALGYGIHPGVFTGDELESLGRALQSADVPRTRAGARHLMHLPPVARLARDPRLLALADAWLNAAAIPYRATFFDKSPDANWLVAWHQDTALPVADRRNRPGWGPWSEKSGVLYAHAPADVLTDVIALRIHLDDSNEHNGPLRVLPGTHAIGVLSDAQVGERAQQVPAVTCCVPAGGVIAMRPLIIHASSKVRSPSPRRVLHVEYASSLRTRDGVTLREA